MMGRGAPFYSPFHSAVWGSAFGSNSAAAAASAAKTSYNGGSPNGGNNNASSGGSTNNNNNFAYPPTPPKDSSTPDQQVSKSFNKLIIKILRVQRNEIHEMTIYSSFFISTINITNLQ